MGPNSGRFTVSGHSSQVDLAFVRCRHQAVSLAEPTAEAEYLAGVCEALTGPSCVQVRFGLRDRLLAGAWRREGVPLRDVRRAILLGSVRKSMSLLDRPGGEPVRSLHYFAGPLEEVRRESFPASYWRHLEFNLRRCEKLWRERPVEGAGR